MGDNCSELISEYVQGAGSQFHSWQPLGARRTGMGREVSSLHMLRESQLSAGAEGWAQTPRTSKATGDAFPV